VSVSPPPTRPATILRPALPPAVVPAELLLRLQKYRDLARVPPAIRQAAEEVAAEASRLIAPQAVLWRGPVTAVDPDGEVTLEKLPNSSATDPATDWPAKPWYSHEVTLTNGNVVSSAVIDHPANPPSLWHGARGVSFLNPCISAPAEVKMPPGKPLTLLYVAVALDGKFPAGWLDAVADGWRAR